MEEQNIELANAGQMLQDVEALDTSVQMYELSDFEIVWNAAVRDLRKANENRPAVLKGTGCYIEGEPRGSANPDEIRLYGIRCGRLDTVVLGREGPRRSHYLERLAEYYHQTRSYSATSGDTLLRVDEIASDILAEAGFDYARSHERVWYWEDGRRKKYPSAKQTNTSDGSEQTQASQKGDPDKQDITPDLEIMLANVRGVKTDDVEKIVSIIREEAEKLTETSNKPATMKKLLKATLARLHPDRDMGNAELFKITSSVYEKLKRETGEE